MLLECPSAAGKLLREGGTHSVIGVLGPCFLGCVFSGVKQQGLGQLLWSPVFCVLRYCHWLTTSSWKQGLESVIPLTAFMHQVERGRQSLGWGQNWLGSELSVENREGL